MLDTGPRSLTVDVSCPRSCSIDSLRTPGHSRSVSHDSYFDLLQSPLRGGMTTTCPSRELSELGLNFDREEPEMRLFSESESLVSSPKVTKDNVPRRVLRARPEECSNTANSVNPSPKKQPRLNLSSPGELKTWASIINEATNESSKDDDESLCKRTKLEDQLSDIQFIDCNTPEHSITANSNVNTGYTIYTQIQIHNPPSIFSDRQEQHKTIINTTTSPPASETANERYSYPVTQYTTFAQQSKKDDRFSYPIAITTTEKSTVDKSNENVQKMNISESPPTILGVTKKTNITDTSDSQRNSDVMSKSKLSIQTPSSPMKSPCYSLLIGSTASSATPSPANTPTYDMDICSHYEPIEFSAKEVVVRQANEEKKTEMSLDLKNRISVTSPETSQSMTPSEIGYQNLYNRQYSVTPELDDAIKPTIVTVSSPAKLSPQASGKVSPIKSTINITYNLKSPKAESNEPNKFFSDEMKKEGLLETSFDDTMVYEQVKFFKSAVDQVNDLVDGKTPTQPQKEETYAEDQYEVVFKNDKMMMMSDIQMKDERGKEEQVHELKVDFDQELEAQDSLEFDQNMSLYENVEVKKPEKVYENVPLPSSLTNSPVRQLKVTFDKNCSNDELESGRHEEKSDLSFTNVRKLANKFETSPIDCQPSYDFNSSPSRKSEVQLRKTNRNPDLYTITRSLDENAFIREFGSARKFEEFNKSINEIADRRKSIDYSKPKSLNQPKKLPGLQTTNNQEKHEHCKKTIGDVEHKLKLNITNEEDYVDSQRSPSFNPERTPLQNFNVRITPTTENRISLIQSNFEDKKLEDGKSTSLSNLKTLKLDRERIEKIKEERRHQLNEKYRSESFRNLNNNVKITKPKSKTELDIDDFHDDIAINNQRFKVKIHTNFDQPSSLTSTSSSSITNLTSRTRRISDEKNQNDIDSGSDDQVVLRKKETDESSSDSKSSNRSKFEKRTFETSRERNNSSNSLRFSQTSNQ
jgi:Rho GTPase-activating protein 32